MERYIVGRFSTGKEILVFPTVEEARACVLAISKILEMLGLDANPYAVYTSREWAKRG